MDMHVQRGGALEPLPVLRDECRALSLHCMQSALCSGLRSLFSCSSCVVVLKVCAPDQKQRDSTGKGGNYHLSLRYRQQRVLVVSGAQE